MRKSAIAIESDSPISLPVSNQYVLKYEPASLARSLHCREMQKQNLPSQDVKEYGESLLLPI